MKKLLVGFLALATTGCADFLDTSATLETKTKGGYVATESVNEAELKNFQIQEPKPLVNAGKTVIDGRFLYILENRKGIHVFDNFVPQTPQPVLFIQIPAVTNFLLSDEILVSDNGNDLVAFNIEAVKQVAVLGQKVSDVAANRAYFSMINTQQEIFNYPNYPEVRNAYFQCADTLGFVTAWKLDTATTKFTCYR